MQMEMTRKTEYQYTYQTKQTLKKVYNKRKIGAFYNNKIINTRR